MLSRPIANWYLFTFFLLLAHCFAAFNPAYANWGFSFWSVVDRTLTVAILSLLGLSLLPLLSTRIGSWLTKAMAIFDRPQSQTGRRVLSTIFLIAAFIGLYLLRSKAHIYGDGYTILAMSSNADEPLFYAQKYMHPFSVLFFRLIFSVDWTLLGILDEQVFAAINVAGGVAGFLGLLCLCRRLIPGLPGLTLFLAGCTSASILLFFGYIELYTWPTALMLWLINATIKYLKEDGSIMPVIVLGILALGSHMITFPAVLATFVAIVQKRCPTVSIIKTVNIVIALGSLIIVAGVQASSLPMIFTPIWSVPGNSYTAFSPDHWIDLFNLFMHVAPLAMVGMMAFVFTRREKSDVGNLESYYLGSTALYFILASFWINPILGAARDWDLLSLFGIPFTVWIAYRMIRQTEAAGCHHYLIVPILVVLTLNTVPNVIEKHDLDKALLRLDPIVWADPHYQITYDNGYRNISWATILRVTLKREDLAEKYFRRRLRGNPNSHLSLSNLGDIVAARGKNDSAMFLYESALAIRPENVAILNKCADLLSSIGQKERALRLFRQAEAVEPDNIATLTGMGILFTENDQFKPALQYFRRAHELSPNTYDQLLNLGIYFHTVERYDSAITYFEGALELASRDSRPEIMGELVISAVKSQRLDKAQEVFDRLKKQYPDWPDLAYLRDQLRQGVESTR